jgi:hypothetical protein
LASLFIDLNQDNGMPQCPNGSLVESRALISLPVLISGMILLGAFCLKFLDEFFYWKFSLSSLFAVGVAVDILVGSMMVANSRSLASAGLGCCVFSTYFVYQLFSDQQICDCFGKLSDYVGWYTRLGITFICLLLCLFSVVVKRSQTDSQLQRDRKVVLRLEPILAAMCLGLGVLVSLTVIRHGFGRAYLYGVVTKVDSSGDRSRLDGELVVYNKSTSTIVLLGNRANRCNGGVVLEEPLAVPPGQSIRLSGEFVPSRRSLFASGFTPIVVNLEGKAQIYRLNWIAELDGKVSR